MNLNRYEYRLAKIILLEMFILILGAVGLGIKTLVLYKSSSAGVNTIVQKQSTADISTGSADTQKAVKSDADTDGTADSSVKQNTNTNTNASTSANEENSAAESSVIEAAEQKEKKEYPPLPDLDLNSWELMLVNADHPLSSSYVPELSAASSMTSGTEQDSRIALALTEFAQAGEAAGLPVYLSSGYRSYEDQDYLFRKKCEQYDYEQAVTIVAPPGTSEHQTGLCCDITDVYREYKNEELEDTETFQWLSEHCAEYGFIVRYPNGKSEITGIMYEPWHFRYVGIAAANYITENELTLEEFLELYQTTQEDNRA